MAARKLGNWVESFVNYTQEKPTNELFRKWTAISIISGALGMNVWVRTMGSNLYPGLYAVLVAPPGIGKTVMTAAAINLWKKTDGLHLSPSSLSRASLIDSLHAAERSCTIDARSPPTVLYNSLLIAINELSTLIPAYDNEFMGTLTDIYDNLPYGEKKRTKDIDHSIALPQFIILAACTPSYLSSTIPEGAWDQGFLSRVVLVFSGESIRKSDLFEEHPDKMEQEAALVHDLKIISKLAGKIEFTPEAARKASKWHAEGCPPTVDHPKLVNYATRRTVHFLKLCMVACVSRGSPIIDEEDLNTALNWLLDAELRMPEIFDAMAQGGDGRIIQDTLHYAWTLWLRDKDICTEGRILEYLASRTSALNAPKIFDLMVKSGMLKKELNIYRPREPRR